MSLQTVNEASTWSWTTRIKGFVACFVVGGVCTLLVRMADLGKANVVLALCPSQQGRDHVARQVLLALRNADGS